MRWVVLEDKQAISRSDDTEGSVMGVFAPGYAMHQYEAWLLTQVANILDDALGISSAGLLKGGAIAWVEVSVPETIETPEGVTFRPNLLATTSFDGSIATTYKRSINNTVCDNTRDLVLAGAGEQVKVKHSRHSHLRLADARAALSMIYTTTEDFMAEIQQLCAMEVSQQHWNTFLGAWVPLVDDKGEPLKGRSKTMAESKRAILQKLYRHDDRVAPWAGTAHGVLQAVNTMEHHEGIVRGATRPDRNMLRTVTGDFANLDREVMTTLSKVLKPV
jgi:phage/plasmid-like protein (TIGR03299 family)